MLSSFASFGKRKQQEKEDEQKRHWGFANAVSTVNRTSPSEFEPSYQPQSQSRAGGYSHNTYHGQVRHQRTPLFSESAKPPRLADNTGQQYVPLSLPAHSQRRRSSTASNDSEVGFNIS